MKIPSLDWRNSFFTRIFLWFWLVTLTSLTAGALVANLMDSEESISTPTADQLSLLERAAERIQRVPNMNINRLQRILKQGGNSRGRLAFVVDLQSKKFIYSFTPSSNVQKGIYLQLVKASEPMVIEQAKTEFVGPKRLTIGDKDYALFIGSVRSARESRIQLLIVIGCVAVLVSGLLCYWLARSFARPLSEIQSTTTRLAKGDLTARVSLSQSRNDEFSQLTDETNKMAEQLQNLFSEHQRFLADVSHELRSPLTRLQMAIGIAEQSIESGNTAQYDPHVIQRVIKETDQMENMIGQLLWLSRHQAEMAAFSAETFEVESLISALLEDLHFEALGQDKVIEIKWQAKVKSQAITVDAEMVLHALENICRNAIKYATKDIALSVEIIDSGVMMTICDDGPGVALSDLDKIFMPFYRCDSSRNRDSGGTGLGLSIAQRAIERHGGNIVAKLHQPHGLVVSIWLPMSSAKKDVASR